MCLNELEVGKTAFVKDICARGIVKRRMLDLGIIPGTKIKALMESPSGELTAYLIRGTVIAIRQNDAKNISI